MKNFDLNDLDFLNDLHVEAKQYRIELPKGYIDLKSVLLDFEIAVQKLELLFREKRFE